MLSRSHGAETLQLQTARAETVAPPNGHRGQGRALCVHGSYACASAALAVGLAGRNTASAEEKGLGHVSYLGNGGKWLLARFRGCRVRTGVVLSLGTINIWKLRSPQIPNTAEFVGAMPRRLLNTN